MVHRDKGSLSPEYAKGLKRWSVRLFVRHSGQILRQNQREESRKEQEPKNKAEGKDSVIRGEERAQEEEIRLYRRAQSHSNKRAHNLIQQRTKGVTLHAREECHQSKDMISLPPNEAVKRTEPEDRTRLVALKQILSLFHRQHQSSLYLCSI